MRIILACLNADFGQDGKLLPDGSNASWEKTNLYPAFKELADKSEIQLETHWLDQQNTPLGYDRLLSLAKFADCIFLAAVNHSYNIPLQLARQIIDAGIPIVDFSPDTHARWRGPDNWGIARWNEGYITHMLTPAKHMIPIMEQDGVKCKWMPFGVPAYSRKVECEKKYDVSFVGQKHGIRGDVIKLFLNAGIKIDLWGHFWDGWPNWHGRPSYTEMNQIFNESKINLNLRWTSRNPNWGQIKGRDFELLGCGAFMIASQHVECNDLHELYIPGEEFVEHHYMKEVAESIKHYLNSPDERERITQRLLTKREPNLWTSRIREFVKYWPSWKIIERLIHE